MQSQTDTSFWFVAPDVSASFGDNPVNLYVQTYNQAATVLVRQPANPTGVNATLTIPANTVVALNLTASLSLVESAPVNTVSNKGVYISSNSNVSVLYTIGSANNMEMISLKGSKAKGTEFYLPVPNSLTTAVSYTDAGVGCEVVATGTGVTTLVITPRAACIGRAKNVTFSVSLNQGQTYSLRDNNNVNPSELAGSIISSNKPVAVTISGMVQNAVGCYSYYADQITSSAFIGKEYVVLRGSSTTERAYILSTLNNTSLTVTSGTTVINTVLNFGETYSVTMNSSICHVSADKPVYVMHASGFGCRTGAAQVSPAYCAGSYTTAFTRLNSDSLYLNIFTRTGYQNTFTLTSNGTPVPVGGANFTVVPGSGGALVAARMMFSTLNIAPGSYNVLSNTQDIFGLGVMNGNSSIGSAYAYASDFAGNAFVIPNASPTATICSNSSFTLNGIVGGGPTTGLWSHNGYGSFSGAPSQLVNNIYIPNPIDTSVKPVIFTLTSTGNCPNVSGTFSLTVTQAPLVNAGADQVVCSNNPTLQLSGSVIGPTNQGQWSVQSPGSGTFSPVNTILNPSYLSSNADTSLQQIKIILTSTLTGCNPVSDTMLVYMNKAPVVKASTLNPIVRCSNNANVSLNGTISGTVTSSGQWTTTGTGYFSPNNLALASTYVPGPADISTGSVTLKLTSINNQQCKAVTDSVLVLFTQPASVNLGADMSSCKNNPVVYLNAGIGGTVTGTGIWTGGSGTFVPSNTALSPTYIATPGEVTTGFVILSFSTTNNGLCNAATDQLRIDFKEKPLANFTVNTVCLTQLTKFTDTSIPKDTIPIVSWQWNFGDGNTSTQVNPQHTYTSSGNYTTQLVISSQTGCRDTIRRTVTVNAIPIVSLTVGRACSGSSLQINFKDTSFVSAPSQITGYYWDFGGFGFSYAKDTSIIFPSKGVYFVSHEVTTDKGCKTTVSQTVNVTPVPVARFLYINNTGLSMETEISFIDSSQSAVSWNWNFGNGQSSTLQNPSTTYTANGDYTVSLSIKDQFGCPSTYTALIRISNIASEIEKLIPNIVSPNGDGKNDIWRLDFIEVFFKTAEIEIYNRWGDQIFRSEGYANAWDGSYKGSPLPVGVYFYIIKLNDKDNTVYKGTITLIK